MAKTRTVSTSSRAATRGGPIAPSTSRNGKVIRFGKPRPQATGENDNELTALFGVEPFLRNQLTRENLDHLRNRMDSEGCATVAKELEISELTLFRVCSGFGHRCRLDCAAKVRAYFARSKR